MERKKYELFVVIMQEALLRPGFMTRREPASSSNFLPPTSARRRRPCTTCTRSLCLLPFFLAAGRDGVYSSGGFERPRKFLHSSIAGAFCRELAH